MARPKTQAGPASRARGAAKKDAVREALEAPQDAATGRPLLDLLAADTALDPAARARIAAFAERTLTGADLAAMLAYRIEVVARLNQTGELTADRMITAWDKLGVFAVSVVQAQAANNGAGGADITVTFGGFQPPAPPAGRVPRRTDVAIGDIVDTE